MTEVASARFHSMAAELRLRVAQAAIDFANEHGQTLDVTAMAQAQGRLEELIHETLTVGMDIWVHDSDEPEVELGPNVVAFTPKRKPRSPLPFFKTALSTVGAVVGSTLLAAATTDAVDFPGLTYVAEVVYRHNPPEREVRIVELNGRYMKVVADRRAGEPVHVLHVAEIQQITDPIQEGIPGVAADAVLSALPSHQFIAAHHIPQ